MGFAPKQSVLFHVSLPMEPHCHCGLVQGKGGQAARARGLMSEAGGMQTLAGGTGGHSLA